MARNYGIPGRQASPERADQEQPAQGSHPERGYKMILEFIGWFAFMLMMATVCITFGQEKIMGVFKKMMFEESDKEDKEREAAERKANMKADMDEYFEDEALIEEQIQTQIEEQDFKDV